LVILTTLLYILGILLTLILFIVLFVLIIPFQYGVKAGYEKSLWFKFDIRCSPAFILRGSVDEAEAENAKNRFMLIIFGLPFNINPQRIGKKKKVESERKEKKKKGSKSLLTLFNKELRVRGKSLIQELLHILKPDLFHLKGSLGFDEPHLTGWLAAAISTIKYCCNNTLVEIEPYWEDEHYEFNALIKGRLRVGPILIKVGWFFLTNRIRLFSKRSEKPELTGSINI